MAFFFGDGFDLYAQPVDATASYWDPVSANPNNSTLVAGRFSGSRAWNWSSSSTLIKASGQNDTVHHFVVAFLATGIAGSSIIFYIELFDGTTAQCTVAFRSDGAIVLISGGPTGTVLATYNGAFPGANIWYAFEIEVVVNSTTGSITIRRNGNVNNDFSAGSLNTRNSTNNYANKLQLGLQSNTGYGYYTDDFLWRSDAASVPWIGDVRCYTRRPASDVSVQFSRTSAAYNLLMWNPVNVGQAWGVNAATYMQIIASASGLLSSVLLSLQGGGTGHIKAAVFSSVNNTIGSVLATSSEITNPPATPATLNFPTPAYLTAGQPYWIGFIQDTNTITYNVVSTPTPNIISLSTTPYASWPVPSPGGVIAGANVPGLTIAITPQSNSDTVSELYQDATATYVYSSTNGQNDLYTIGSIGATPLSIIGVTTRGFFEKSDAGTRNATVQLKSGATTVQGPNTALNTVWGWIYRSDPVDPATGIAWTAPAVNSVNIGPVVTA